MGTGPACRQVQGCCNTSCDLGRYRDADALLAVFAPLFTAPSFRTFCGLACGFLAQPGKRTVCGMLEGAALSRQWSHDRAHSFFARGRWKADELGIAVARRPC